MHVSTLIWLQTLTDISNSSNIIFKIVSVPVLVANMLQNTKKQIKGCTDYCYMSSSNLTKSDYFAVPF